MFPPGYKINALLMINGGQPWAGCINEINGAKGNSVTFDIEGRGLEGGGGE